MKVCLTLKMLPFHLTSCPIVQVVPALLTKFTIFSAGGCGVGVGVGVGVSTLTHSQSEWAAPPGSHAGSPQNVNVCLTLKI